MTKDYRVAYVIIYTAIYEGNCNFNVSHRHPVCTAIIPVITDIKREKEKNSDSKIGADLCREHWEVLGTLPFSIILQNYNGGSIWLMTVLSQFNSLGLMLHGPAQKQACPSPGTGTQPLCCVISSTNPTVSPH